MHPSTISLQQTLFKFSWSGDNQARLNGRSNASLEAMQANSSAIMGSAAFKNLPHYFQMQDDSENAFMSQSEMSQVWDFTSSCLGTNAVVLGSDFPTSGSEFPTSGSEDYPQTSLSTGESQKSSSSYSNKESQNEFDDGDTHPQIARRAQATDPFRIKSLDTSPQGSGYVFAGHKNGHMHTATNNVRENAIHQNTHRLSHELSNDQSMDDDTALSHATEVLPPTNEAMLMNESHISLSKTRMSPVPSMPNKVTEHIFARKLYQSLAQCQQAHQRWPSSEDNDSCSHQGAMLQTEQELTTIQNLKENPACVSSSYMPTKKEQSGSQSPATQAQPVQSVPSQPLKPASSTSKANWLPTSNSNKVEGNVSSDIRISSQSSTQA